MTHNLELPCPIMREVLLQQQLILLLPQFNGLFSTTTWVSRYQKGKTGLDINEARDDGVWGRQRHQLDYMQTICTSIQPDYNPNTASLDFSQAGCSS